MSPKPLSTFQQAWFKWKALRLPWRRRIFVGHDLLGNTYWTFHLPGTPPSKWRRIVHYPRSTHLSEVKVPPQWHSWLRYTRPEAPTMEEQISEATRQERIKILAARADRRWDAKPKVMEDGPNRGRTPSLGPSVPSVEGAGGTGVPDASTPAPEPSTATRGGQGEKGGGTAPEKGGNPWATTKGPSEDWAPQAWTPTPKK